MKRNLLGLAVLWICVILWGLLEISDAQQIDDSLRKIMENAKKEMPGISYEILKGARDEGKLMFYHLVTEGPLVQEFNKRFPFITVQEYFASGGPLFQKFTSEARARKNFADIWQHTDIAAMNKVADEGLLMNYKITSDAYYPEAFKRSSFWYPFRYTQVVVAWNKDIVKDEEAIKRFKTWEGLPDPHWRDKKVGLVVIQSGGTVQAAYYMLQEKYGIDFWKKLAAMKPQLYEGVNPLADAVASGELALALLGSETGFFTKFMRGAPVHWTNPEPRIVVPYGQAIAKAAPHPNAAKLFQEFIFSEAGQKIFAEYVGASFRVGDLRKHVKEPWYNQPALYPYDMEKIFKSMRGSNGLISQWNKIFRK